MLSAESKTDELTQQVRVAEEAFFTRHGFAPGIVVAAPGRVNLIGEHVDYNDGFVLPMAIERYVVIAASRVDSKIGQVQDPSHPSGGLSTGEIYSVNLDRAVSIELGSLVQADPDSSSWTNYVRGVIAGFQACGTFIPGFKAVIASSIPVGGGLSSSAAMEVATATLMEALTHTTISKRQKSLLCQQAEHEFANVPCGIMDQFSSVFGELDQLMLIDCQSQSLELIRFLGSDCEEDVVIMIANSNVHHELSVGEYALRKQQCDAVLEKLELPSYRQLDMFALVQQHQLLSALEFGRARHVLTEIQRTQLAAKAFSKGDWVNAGQLMYESHSSLRNDFEVSCPELDGLVEIVKEIGSGNGVWGSRMTGGGFGGCTVSLVQADRVESIMDTLKQKYFQRFGLSTDIFVSRPAAGATVIRC